MPATVPTRGVLKASQNRVRTSVALQGSAMWENVIGVVNEERGANADVEALINAPQRGGGRQAAQARRAAAAEAVRATGGFDTAITSYNELLTLAKSQGAVGGGAARGACKVCGQLGHLTKQCRNQFSKFFQEQQAAQGRMCAAGPSVAGIPPAEDSEDSLSSLIRSGDDVSDSASSSDSEAEHARKRRRKEKHKKRERREKRHRRGRDDERRHRRDRKEKKRRKERRRSRSKSRSKSPLDV